MNKEDLMQPVKLLSEKKKAYVKPTLATHGDVRKLTEGGGKPHTPDLGSNIRFPWGGKW